jgi:hypothetical protein
MPPPAHPAWASAQALLWCVIAIAMCVWILLGVLPQLKRRRTIGAERRVPDDDQLDPLAGAITTCALESKHGAKSCGCGLLWCGGGALGPLGKPQLVGAAPLDLHVFAQCAGLPIEGEPRASIHARQDCLTKPQPSPSHAIFCPVFRATARSTLAPTSPGPVSRSIGCWPGARAWRASRSQKP